LASFAQEVSPLRRQLSESLRTRHTLEPLAWHWSHWPGRLPVRELRHSQHGQAVLHHVSIPTASGQLGGDGGDGETEGDGGIGGDHWRPVSVGGDHWTHCLPIRLCSGKEPALTKFGYRGTSLTRKRTPLGPYRRPMPRALWWSCGGGGFL